MYGPFNFYQGRLAGWVTFAGSPFSPKETLSLNPHYFLESATLIEFHLLKYPCMIFARQTGQNQ